MAHFLLRRGKYRNLIVFGKTECIYDITWIFINRWLNPRDRTYDQMLQAARSGKQNIAEGWEAGMTSSETCIKLMNVARASLQELSLDYEDYLRTRGLEKWDVNDPRTVMTRRIGMQHNNPAYFVEAMKVRSAETVANIAITLVSQADALLNRLISSLEKEFVKNGGIRERMYKARTSRRGY